MEKRIANHIQAARDFSRLAVIMAVVLGVRETESINSVTSIRRRRNVNENISIMEKEYANN